MRNNEARETKVIRFLHGRAVLHTPPMTESARQRTGELLRELQNGIALSMPQSRPMPTIGSGCYELRIPDGEIHTDWRVIYALTDTEIVVLDVFAKKTKTTPDAVIKSCRARLANYLN